MERFLITGLPRVRSAWLTALISTTGATVTHESKAPPLVGGWCDPTAACICPKKAIKWAAGHPTVIILRDPEVCRASWERWTGHKLLNFDALVANYHKFVRAVTHDDGGPYTIRYEHLDIYSEVADLVHHCTGKYLNKSTWELFDKLKIEQHLGKVRGY